MSDRIYRTYKTLSENESTMFNSKFKIPFGIYFLKDKCFNLELKSIGDTLSNEYSIENTDEWDAKTCKCKITQELNFDIDLLKNLFQGENSITAKDSKLGIAALWYIDKTGIRGCEKLNCEISLNKIKRSNNIITAKYEQIFLAGYLSGTLTVKFILYLKEMGLRKEFGKANTIGTVLGEIVKPLIIHIDGDMSTFPITTVYAPEKSLWWVDFNSEVSPLIDPFSEEYVSIVLNEAHECYNKLKSGKEYNTPLFYEVLASAFEEIFRFFYYSDPFKDEMSQTENFKTGSIASALDYIKNSFDIKTDTPRNCHETIRKMIRDIQKK